MLAFCVPVAHAFLGAFDYVRDPQHRLVPDRTPWFFFFRYLKAFPIRKLLPTSLVWILVIVVVVDLIRRQVSSGASVTYYSTRGLVEFLIGMIVGLWMINLAACVVAAPRCRRADFLAALMFLSGWAYLVAIHIFERGAPYDFLGVLADALRLDSAEDFIEELPLLDHFFISGVRGDLIAGGSGILKLPLFARHWFNALIPTLILLLAIRWAAWRGGRWFRLDKGAET